MTTPDHKRAPVEIEPDLVFGLRPGVGVVAEGVGGRARVEEVLRRHHFRPHPVLGVYVLPSGAPYNRVLRAVTGAARALRDAGLPVTADPLLLVPRPSRSLLGWRHGRRFRPSR
ncbi:hypothetical protein RKE29_01500 [Streptomyces sp. B1866]|uniref:hypothetical protein n=1 Tax=Streptomyces sp. B1866 TaxID=3075431 RepID=UPI00288E459B|nr:hypothetical protein [Streptomyces sp. B1866]MDT3395335.1 hypothetical protein [Streptomyces sp. B1866]